MNMKKLLVPVDGSDHSMKAAHYSVELAKQFNSEVILLHCHKPFPLYLGEPQFQEVVTQTIEKANQLIDIYRTLYDDNKIKFTGLLLEEPAGKVIADVVKNEKIDLVIMGSRGRSDLESLILGSTTHKVLHMAECPVLVVK